MTSLLGQVRWAGGLHQFIYYKVFKDAFLKSLDTSICLEKELFELINSQELNHWGSHVLEPDIDVSELILKHEKVFDKFSEYFANISFDECIDDMKQFRIYHRWAELLKNL